MPTGKWIENLNEILHDLDLNDLRSMIPDNVLVCFTPQTHKKEDHPMSEFIEIEWTFAGARYDK